MLELIKKYINREKAPEMLRWPVIYTLGQAMVRSNLLRFPYRATALMVEYGLEETKKVYNRRLPFVWTSAFFPTELLHALGIPIFSPEVAAALAASFGFQEHFLKEAESRWWGRDNCSFHRCAIGGLFSRYYPLPSAFCASSHLCEGAVLMFSSLARVYNRPFLLLDVPVEQDDDSLSYVTGQLWQIISSLEEITGISFQHEKLQEAVANAEGTRRVLQKINELRLHPYSPFTAKEAFNFLYLNFTGLGSRAMLRVYETLAKELEERIRENNTFKKPPRFKLLWLHLPPFYRNNILEYLEEKGARVVFEEFNHVYWGAMDASRPLESIAGRMLSHFSYGHISRRIEIIKELAAKYDVDGVIHFSHWGCRQSCGSLRIIRDSLQKEGLPFLVLDGDCVDNRNYAPGQVQTRIDGFLEMLG
jgi:benzoyl-CoA reductase/2-hydroxyglutaryl-CoA dehydratase subunit BcrC/BadD/HgdB